MCVSERENCKIWIGALGDWQSTCLNRDLYLSYARYVSPCFSSLLGFISSLPQLAWDKRLCCCCFCCCNLSGLTAKELSNQLITSWIFFVQSWSGQITGSSKIVPHTDEVEHRDSSILLAAASHFSLVKIVVVW